MVQATHAVSPRWRSHPHRATAMRRPPTPHYRDGAGRPHRVTAIGASRPRRATAPPRHRATAPPRHRATAPPRHRDGAGRPRPAQRRSWPLRRLKWSVNSSWSRARNIRAVAPAGNRHSAQVGNTQCPLSISWHDQESIGRDRSRPARDNEYMRQLQFFTSSELAAMRDRTASRNYSPERDEFRREHERHRAWGLTQRHARRLRQLRGRGYGRTTAGPDEQRPENPQPTRPAGSTHAKPARHPAPSHTTATHHGVSRPPDRKDGDQVGTRADAPAHMDRRPGETHPTTQPTRAPSQAKPAPPHPSTRKSGLCDPPRRIFPAPARRNPPGHARRAKPATGWDSPTDTGHALRACRICQAGPATATSAQPSSWSPRRPASPCCLRPGDRPRGNTPGGEIARPEPQRKPGGGYTGPVRIEIIETGPQPIRNSGNPQSLFLNRPIQERPNARSPPGLAVSN
ncbi:hypothetical protein BJ971_004285 [Actinoplanes digitatis]|uniref:Uncharacterized protein n=1 Tax=Actinoplanes digitatis TaxID=1868 RepID=A0A7W7MRQ5_9ACTN|nr:hypothetical protein [Actinoplanes digitatis]